MKKTLTLPGLTMATGLFLASCSSDSPTPIPSTQGKMYKFTITVTGANHTDELDYISFVFAGGTTSQNKSIWKINGVLQPSQQGIGLDESDFGAGNTIVVESAEPILSTQANVQCINFDNPFTLSFKAEVDGEVKVNDQNVTVTEGNDYTHDYSL